MNTSWWYFIVLRLDADASVVHHCISLLFTMINITWTGSFINIRLILISSTKSICTILVAYYTSKYNKLYVYDNTYDNELNSQLVFCTRCLATLLFLFMVLWTHRHQCNPFFGCWRSLSNQFFFSLMRVSKDHGSWWHTPNIV